MNTRHIAGRTLPTTAVLLVALAAGLGLWLGSRLFGSAAAPTTQAALMYPAARPVPDFTLQRADGKTLTQKDWQGRWTLVFFGYTHCPDVCPTTLATLKQVWTKLDATTRQHLAVDFISVDPQRDTPEQLGKYVGFFSPDFVAATGSDEVLAPLTRSLGLLYMRAPKKDGEDKDGEYNVDHSAQVILVNPRGQVAGMFRPPLDPAKMAADLALLAATP
jgi:protein SCO1/2